jgi:hypothetical protein
LPERQAGASDSLPATWIGFASEAERLKRINNACNMLGELSERWNNRLVLENITFGEEYAKGRMSIALYFGLRAGQNFVRTALHREVLEHEVVFVATCERYVVDGEDINCGNKELMLIDVVQGGNLPNLKIPSLVRLYLIDNEIGQIGRGFLYASIWLGGYNIVPFSACRKRNPIIARNSIDGYVIQSDPQIMNGITDNQGYFFWRLGDKIQLHDIISGLGIMFDMKSIRICLDKRLCRSMKILDVAIGPLDL